MSEQGIKATFISYYFVDYVVYDAKNILEYIYQPVPALFTRVVRTVFYQGGGERGVVY